MKPVFFTFAIKKPLLFGCSVFFAVALLTQYLSYLRYLIGEESERKNVLHEINSVEDKLKAALSYNLSATKTLAFIVENYGVPENFDSIAKGILQSSKNIDALQLTRKGVITHTYPMEGNEKAMGYDVLKDSLTNKEAYKAIEKKALFFAGPFELRQGGMGVVGRLPVFINHEFWGFSVVIIKWSTLLNAAGINTSENSQFVYQLSKVNPNTKQEEFFLPTSIPLNKKHSVAIEVIDGEWNLYVMSKNNNNYFYSITFSFIGLALSFICGVFAWHLASQPQKLNHLVEERTAELINSQNNYKITHERISDAFVALDNNWRYTFLNKAALATHPQGLKETLGKVIWEVHPEMKNTIFWHKYHEAMETKRVVEMESYYAPMDKYFSVKIYPSTEGLTIFYLDITERKIAEQKIIQEKKLSESIINSLPGIFYSYDRNGKFMQWNKNFETVSGYSAEEISRMHPLDFFDTDEKELLKSQIDLVFGKGSANVEAGFFTKSKKKIPYYFNGHLSNLDGVDYLLGAGIDITERKKAETALKESEEKYRYLFNNNPAIIIIWDLETFAIMEVNNVAPKQYGYTREELLNMTVLELMPEEDKDRIKDFSKKMLAGNEIQVKRTWQHFKKNGEIMYMDISAHRIDFHHRKSILSMATDITEQLLAENQLKENYDDIRRLNAHLQTIREEERTSIAREIHDELGQQLTALKMDVSWLTKKIALEETVQQEKLAGMIALIDDTVITIRRISSDLRPGVLDDLGLLPALEWQSNEFEKRTGIRCEIQSNISDLELEKNLASCIFRIYQEALTNIMRHSNATKVNTSMEKTDHQLILSIQDNGDGFNVADVKNKNNLGLTGMKERALMFNGQLKIDSKKGHGTLVVLEIPLSSSYTNS